MSWTTPIDWEAILDNKPTVVQFNEQIRDNMLYLKDISDTGLHILRFTVNHNGVPGAIRQFKWPYQTYMRHWVKIITARTILMDIAIRVDIPWDAGGRILIRTHPGIDIAALTEVSLSSVGWKLPRTVDKSAALFDGGYRRGYGLLPAPAENSVDSQHYVWVEFAFGGGVSPSQGTMEVYLTYLEV